MNGRRLLIILALAVSASTVFAAASSAVGELVFSPASNDFGSVQAGQSSSSQTFTITNQSGSDQSVDPSGVTKTGSDPTEFALSNDTCATAGTLADQGTCSVEVIFSPDAAGNFSAELDVTTGGGASVLGSATVSGTGTPAPAPGIDVSPNAWDFGNHKVGTPADTKDFTVTNTGNADLHISGTISVTGTGFTGPSNDGCSGTTVAPGDSCSVTAGFNPSAAGDATGTLSIPADIPASVQLTGKGTVPIASPGAAVSFAAGIGKSQNKPVTLTNTGDAELVISGTPTLSGDASFSNPMTGSCGNAHLAPGASCQTNIIYSPTTNAAASGQLTFTDDSNSNPGSHQSIDLTGTVLLPGIQSTPTAQAFADLAVGRLSTRKVITVKNTGGDDLHVTGFAITGINPGSFVLGNNSCDSAIAPGATCTVNVRFGPVKTGNRIANLIVHNNAGPDQKVSLTGHGVAPADVANSRGAAGCTDARFTWADPDGAGFASVRLVRNGRRFPRSPGDGASVRHRPGVALDTAPRQFHTYYYTLFAMYRSWDGKRMVPARGIDIRIRTGRVCTPRNNSLIADLTPKVDWVAYPHTRSYAFILQRGGTTIDVRYVAKSSYSIPRSWRYNHSTHSLVRGGDYTFYLYAYTRAHPRGVSIGQTRFTERSN